MQVDATLKHFAIRTLHALKLIVQVLVSVPFLIWFGLFFPVSIPAWFLLEVLHDGRYGSGFHPVANPVREEWFFRFKSWLACTMVAGLYIIVLQYFSGEYNLLLLITLAPAIGFVAVQGLFLFKTSVSYVLSLLFSKPELLYAPNGVTYELKHIQPGEDSHLYQVIRHVPDSKSSAVAFMSYCETPFAKDLKMKSCDGTAVVVEGIFSYRAFPHPVNQHLSYDRDYGRGVLRIDFASPEAPTSVTVEWLPLAKDACPANHSTEVLAQ